MPIFRLSALQQSWCESDSGSRFFPFCCVSFLVLQFGLFLHLSFFKKTALESESGQFFPEPVFEKMFYVSETTEIGAHKKTTYFYVKPFLFSEFFKKLSLPFLKTLFLRAFIFELASCSELIISIFENERDPVWYKNRLCNFNASFPSLTLNALMVTSINQIVKNRNRKK